MQNYVQSANTITLAAPYDVVSGAGALVGQLFGVAAKDTLSGVSGEFETQGVFDIKAASADTPAVGALVYWDNTAKQITTTSAANSKVGVAVKAKVGGELTCRVRLNGVSVT